MPFSITDWLQNNHGIRCRPGSKVKCPFCGHDAFSIRGDDRLGKCFHPQCGHVISPAASGNDHHSAVFQILQQLSLDFHVAILAQSSLNGRTAYAYCVRERGIHPEVVERAMVGVVPDDYDVEALFEDAVKAAEAGVEAEKEAPKKRGRPPKQDGPTAQEKLDFLVKRRDKLAEAVEYAEGWLVFFYIDADHRVVSMRFREPFTKKCRMFKPTSTGGVFAYGLFSPDVPPYRPLGDEEPIIVEGEFNLLQLESLCVHHADRSERPLDEGYVPALAVGGVHNVDVRTIAKISHLPLVCYDNDEDGAGFQLVEKLREHVHLKAFTTPGRDSDLDSFLRSFGDDFNGAFAAVSNLADQGEIYYRRQTSLKAEINSVRRLRGIKDFEIHQRVSKIIMEDLEIRGCFYRDGERTFLFRNDNKLLMETAKGSSDLQQLLSGYGLSPTEGTFKYMVAELHLKALSGGTQARVHVFSFYDKPANTLYLFDFDQVVYTITSEGVQSVDNGTDGVLFLRNPSFVKFEIGEPEERSVLGELVLDPINFKDGRLLADERRTILLLWFLSIFFAEIFPTRPVIAIVGGAGSGKSYLLRVLGRILLGANFDVTPLSKDLRDFEAAITNSPFVAIDNADAASDWLEDSLAVSATGGSVKRRNYYTTNDMVEFPITAFLGITSRTPHFRREDVAERLILFLVSKYEKFIAESELLDRVDRNRNRIMTEVVHLLQDVLKALEAQPAGIHQTTFRMADFGDFALRISHHQGWGEDMVSLLERLGAEQADFALEDDPLVGLLRRWLQRERNVGREVTAKKLHEDLQFLASRHKVAFLYQDGRAVAQRLLHIKNMLRHHFVFTERLGSGNKKLYSFRLRTTEDDCAEE